MTDPNSASKRLDSDRIVSFVEPAGAYASHRDYVRRAKPEADARRALIREQALRAFKDHLSEERCLVINFRDMNATVLGRILAAHPLLAKPLMILGNVAERAIERDLGLKGLNSYNPRFRRDSAKAIAGYLKPFLPDRIELESFCAIDRLMFLDKEIRKGKGRWERLVRTAFDEAVRSQGLPHKFQKRRFETGNEAFELDAAYPANGPIEIGLDVKRIEARRDVHKRCDEIVNKAAKFKQVYPQAQFVAFIYYPFTDEHHNVSNRLKSEWVDVVVFASEHPDSIRNAALTALKTVRW